MDNQTKNLKELQELPFFKKLKTLPYVETIRANVAEGQREPGKYFIDLAIYCPKATNEDWLSIMAIIDQAETASNVSCLRLDTLQESSILRNLIEFQWVGVYRSYDKH